MALLNPSLVLAVPECSFPVSKQQQYHGEGKALLRHTTLILELNAYWECSGGEWLLGSQEGRSSKLCWFMAGGDKAEGCDS